MESATKISLPGVVVHKCRPATSGPVKVSLILLDWSCRESYHALDWLAKQDVPRAQFEVIWVELFDRVAPEVMEKADVVITCHQRGLYHKHAGYNVGLLHSSGQTITVCDSDAIFPPDFVSSIIRAFDLNGAAPKASLVLMHYEQRSLVQYPKGLAKFEDVRKHKWLELWPNVGACMTVLREDALRFGGFDEHKSYRGYFCGPYDLGWRMINFGIPERWHDESVTLWHFAHPEPAGSYFTFSLSRWREIAHPHVEYHALSAVDAFASGRLLPLQENEHIHKMRLAGRQIGSSLEERMAHAAGPAGFTTGERLKMHAALLVEQLRRMFWSTLRLLFKPMKALLGPERYQALKDRWIEGRRSKRAA